MGGRFALDSGAVRVDLLDAARVDHARLGAGRRPARGHAVRRAELLGEHVLGRRSLGDRRLPGVRRAAAIARGGRARDGAALGIGLGLQLLTRPFEFGVMLLCAAGYLAINRQWRIPWRAAALAFLPALALMALQNHAVTGSWTTLPYQLSRYQYGVPTTFTFQPNPVPHRALTPAQQLDYQAQSAVHDGPGFWRAAGRPHRILPLLFSGAALSGAAIVPASLEGAQVSVGGRDAAFVRDRGQLLSLLLSALHCRAGLSFLLTAIAAMERLSAWSPFAARLIVLLCAAHFIFWYGIHAMRDDNVRLAMARYETWDLSQSRRPGRPHRYRRAARADPGEATDFRALLARSTAFRNGCTTTPISTRNAYVWALDLGADEDRKLMQYYPDRRVWVLIADAKPPRLVAGPVALRRFCAAASR